MTEIEALLQPISEGKPSGDNLKYYKFPQDQVPFFDKIRNARKLEDIAPKGNWERESSPANFGLVAKWTSEAIATRSKDLQLAVWLAEAWTYEQGVKGFVAGLELSRELVSRFWDTIYPALEDGDAEMRASPLDWLGSYFDPAKGSSPILALRSVPITNSGYSWFSYQESRSIGYESEVGGNPARKAARDVAIKEKKVVPEAFDKDFESTKKDFYKGLKKDLETALNSLSALDAVCHEKFEDVAPSFSPLRKAIEEVANVAHILWLKKLQKEPDPAAPEPEAAVKETVAEAVVEEVPADSAPPEVDSGAIGNEAQAMLHVVAAAQYVRRQNPANPASYLLLRALRWGELRGMPDMKNADLPAPKAEVRKALRTAAAAKNWKMVLETSEAAMSEACGRGWLDLQRYSIRASTELGYAAAAKAIRSELKSLLLDFPELTKATLNDDTGAANPETLEWLKQEGLIS